MHIRANSGNPVGTLLDQTNNMTVASSSQMVQGFKAADVLTAWNEVNNWKPHMNRLVLPDSSLHIVLFSLVFLSSMRPFSLLLEDTYFGAFLSLQFVQSPNPVCSRHYTFSDLSQF